jgi:glutamyl-tRNA reductase
MSTIFIIGLNHKTAPIEIRECLAFSQAETSQALEALRGHPAIEEAILFSTCNRVEILFTTERDAAAIDACKEFLSRSKNVPYENFQDALYVYKGDEAVRHLFRVASSLDSMIVGEPQILGQIKEAYRMATEKKSTAVVLNRLLHRSFFVAKRVRTETGIGDRAVSISYAAIELGRKIFGSLEQKKILLIGAGEMAELAVEHLIRNRAGDIYVANRTFERGVALARRFRGTAVRFEEIAEMLETVDVIISSTGSTEFIIGPETLKGRMRRRRNRPLFFIDIAVPRDIDPALNRLDNVYVYDIDDLKSITDENIQDRNREAVRGERIIDEAVIQFRKWCDSLSVVPTIVLLRNKLDAIADAEIKRTLQSMPHLAEGDIEAIHRMKTALINKLLHDPTLFLKENGVRGNLSLYLDMTRKMFKLEEG